MANKDAAFGLRPAKHVSGSPFNGGQSRYRITTSATSYSTNIYMGDIVTQNTGGTITRIARADGGGATRINPQSDQPKVVVLMLSLM